MSEGGTETPKGIESKEDVRGALFVVVDEDNRILMQQRDEHCWHYPLAWCVPGGHRKEGESPTDAAVRELFSEYNISVRAEDAEVVKIHKQPHADGYTQVTLFRIPNSAKNEIVKREGKAYDFYSLDEIREKQRTEGLGFGNEQFLDDIEEVLTRP